MTVECSDVPVVNPRYERKFVVLGHSVAEVRAVLDRHAALFRTAYPPRTVNNIYLDTTGLSDYRLHVNGAAARTKTRVRWYGELRGPACPVLERKQRVGSLGGKETFNLPQVGIEAGDGWTALSGALTGADLPDFLRHVVACRTPTLLNRYHRHYLNSADGRFRITVDSQLRFARAVPFDLARLEAAPPVPGVIVELKYAPADAEDAEAVGHALPFRLGRFSKYVLGVEQLSR
jgi:hypothetical protein